MLASQRHLYDFAVGDVWRSVARALQLRGQHEDRKRV